jgi:hypothetical protein
LTTRTVVSSCAILQEHSFHSDFYPWSSFNFYAYFRVVLALVGHTPITVQCVNI